MSSTVGVVTAVCRNRGLTVIRKTPQTRGCPFCLRGVTISLAYELDVTCFNIPASTKSSNVLYTASRSPHGMGRALRNLGVPVTSELIGGIFIPVFVTFSDEIRDIERQFQGCIYVKRNVDVQLSKCVNLKYVGSRMGNHKVSCGFIFVG